MFRLVALALVALALAGCKSRPLGPYLSPRITGRVLAADTRQPLADVQVTHGKPPRSPMAGWPPKGGELLMRKVPVRTDQNGCFSLASERALTLFRPAGWDSVRLSFERAGYRRFQTNYSASLGTNAPDGQPMLNVGEVLLEPEHR